MVGEDEKLRQFERAWLEARRDPLALARLNELLLRAGKPRWCVECVEAKATTMDCAGERPLCRECRDSELVHGHENGMHYEPLFSSECPLCKVLEEATPTCPVCGQLEATVEVENDGALEWVCEICAEQAGLIA